MQRNYRASILIALALIAAALFYTKPLSSQMLQRASLPAATSSTGTTASGSPVTRETLPVTIPVTASGTVLQAMHLYASSSGFSFTGTEYPSLGLMVDTINGTKNANGYYWFLYINGTSSDLGASSAQVKPGDLVEWRYEQNH